MTQMKPAETKIFHMNLSYNQNKIKHDVRLHFGFYTPAPFKYKFFIADDSTNDWRTPSLEIWEKNEKTVVSHSYMTKKWLLSEQVGLGWQSHVQFDLKKHAHFKCLYSATLKICLDSSAELSRIGEGKARMHRECVHCSLSPQKLDQSNTSSGPLGVFWLNSGRRQDQWA